MGKHAGQLWLIEGRTETGTGTGPVVDGDGQVRVYLTRRQARRALAHDAEGLGCRVVPAQLHPGHTKT